MNRPTFQKAKQLTIYSANCLNQLSPLASCDTCRQICPAEALSLHDGRWQAVDCTLCGLCVAVCPTQVFQIDQPLLLRQPKEPLQLCCSQNAAAPEQAWRLNCLQQLSPLTLLYLLYQHRQITLYLTPDDCQGCVQQWMPQGLLQQLEPYHIPPEQLQIVLQESAGQDQATDDAQPENQRRELLRGLWHRAERQSRQAVEAVTTSFSSSETPLSEPEIFPQRLPLYALYAKKRLPFHPDQQLPFRGLSCQTCNFCGACCHLCPTQALTLTEQDGQRQLFFHPELCVNCGLCQAVCMQHGLQWEDFLTQQQFVQMPQLLAHSPEQICDGCEHSFYQWPPDGQRLCSFCRGRR